MLDDVHDTVIGMRFVSWNMGCAPAPSKYRQIHREAWRYLLTELKPDVALVQEVLLDVPLALDYGQVVWSVEHGHDSGTAIFVRHGLQVEERQMRSAGSYVAGVQLMVGGVSTIIASIHVGPPDYRKHLQTLLEELSTSIADKRFLVGGDLNAARHIDDVYGGHWHSRYFEELAKRGFHDCHWAKHRKEEQSFWGHQAKEAYQCDHLFVDNLTAKHVTECNIVDNDRVRTLSDHGPMSLTIIRDATE